MERRRSTRIAPKGSVILHAGEHVEHGRIANIRSGGLLALTEDLAEIPPGSAVGVELRLDTAGSEWLRLDGRVVRTAGCSVALALETTTERFARLMRDNLSASGEHRRVRPVVLIDATPARRALIAEAFRTSGCAVLEVSTPLEAIVRLGELRFDPELIAIADSLPTSTSDDLRVFVEREHPHAKLVIIDDDILASPESTCRLSASSSHDDLLAWIRELLER